MLCFFLRGYVRCNHVIACFCGKMSLAPTQQIRCMTYMTSKIICHFVVCFQRSFLASKSGASLGCGKCTCCRRQRLICRGRAIKDWMEKKFGSQFADLLRLNALNHWICYMFVDFLHMYRALCTTHKMRCSCMLGLMIGWHQYRASRWLLQTMCGEWGRHSV